MPPSVIAPCGDGHHTHQEIPVANYANSALYSTSPEAMLHKELGLPTRPSVFNTADTNDLQQEGLLLPTREELGARAFDTIRFWMEDGNSQLLSREQALQVAAWALKIAGERDLQHQVLAELVELPDNLG